MNHQFQEGSVTTPAGFVAGTAAAHIKYPNRLDLALIVSERECAAAGVFTRNLVAAAPVVVGRETLAANNHAIRAVVANAGNANACTGETGLLNARRTQELVASAVGCAAKQVLPLSTGVIGVQLPMERMEAGILQAASHLAPEHGRQAAKAIMTTDTRPKHLAVEVALSGGSITIGGIAKGAGMIHPNMATLLGVLTTDAAIAPANMQGLLQTAVDGSFNTISIDGDTSTNDTVLLLANGASGVAVTGQADLARFGEALNALCRELALMIVGDGEGVTKVVTLHVSGAPNNEAARQVANTVATSPLVKTAFAGGDANWGRILAAAGRAGVPFNPALAQLWIGVGIQQADQLQLLRNGTPTDYEEADAAAVFAQPAFQVHLDLGAGSGAATMWTSDLTQEYVRINADYRT